MMHPIGRDYITKAEFEDRQRRAAKPAREQNAADIVRQLVAALDVATTALKAIYNIVDTPEAYELPTSAPVQDVLDQPAVRDTFDTLTAGRAWLEQEGR